MSQYNDGMYIQGVVEEKRPLYIEFIRKILQCYQINKNLFTAYAPDVQFEGIKSSVSQFYSSYVVAPLTEETPLTSPFAEDSSKLNNILSGLPSVHHNRAKRQRREAEQQTLPMVMYDGYDGNYISNNNVLVSPMNSMSNMNGMSSMNSMSNMNGMSNMQGMQPMQMMGHVQMLQQSMPQNVPSVIPMQLQVLQNPNGVMNGQAQMVQPVDGVMMDQQTLDMQALPRGENDLHKTRLEDVEEKGVAYHMVHGGDVMGVGDEMDDKRVKELYVYSVCNKHSTHECAPSPTRSRSPPSPYLVTHSPSLLLHCLDRLLLVGEPRHDHHRTSGPAELRRHAVLSRDLRFIIMSFSHVDHAKVRTRLAAQCLVAPDGAAAIKVGVDALLHLFLLSGLQRLQEAVWQRRDRAVKEPVMKCEDICSCRR